MTFIHSLQDLVSCLKQEILPAEKVLKGDIVVSSAIFFVDSVSSTEDGIIISDTNCNGWKLHPEAKVTILDRRALHHEKERKEDERDSDQGPKEEASNNSAGDVSSSDISGGPTIIDEPKPI